MLLSGSPPIGRQEWLELGVRLLPAGRSYPGGRKHDDEEADNANLKKQHGVAITQKSPTLAIGISTQQ